MKLTPLHFYTALGLSLLTHGGGGLALYLSADKIKPVLEETFFIGEIEILSPVLEIPEQKPLEQIQPYKEIESEPVAKIVRRSEIKPDLEKKAKVPDTNANMIQPEQKPPTIPVNVQGNKEIEKVRGSYEQQLAARLERYKQYPSRALKRGIEGEAYLFLKLDREGKLLAQSLRVSSGSDILDQEVLSLAERATPYPKVPEIMVGSSFDFEIPIFFSIR